MTTTLTRRQVLEAVLAVHRTDGLPIPAVVDTRYGGLWMDFDAPDDLRAWVAYTGDSGVTVRQSVHPGDAFSPNGYVILDTEITWLGARVLLYARGPRSVPAVTP